MRTPGLIASCVLLLVPCVGTAQDTPPFYPTSPGPEHRMVMPDWDVGVGFARLAPSSSGPPGGGAPDTLSIRSEPRETASPRARVYHRGSRLIVEATDPGLQDGALEVGYEERALPVLRTAPVGGWLEVSFAFDEAREPRIGWIRNGPTLEHPRWDEWLRVREGLFFTEPSSVRFFSRPDGEPLQIPLEPSPGSLGYDYSLYPIRVEGEWMEVRVVSPSDYCRDPVPVVDRNAWIRYLSPTDRPQVWYSTRGC